MSEAVPLDQIDRRILHELMRDATLPVSQLAGRASPQPPSNDLPQGH